MPLKENMMAIYNIEYGSCPVCHDEAGVIFSWGCESYFRKLFPMLLLAP